MTTTNTNSSTYDLAAEVARFQSAKHRHETTRLGTVGNLKSWETMCRIVDRAERTGNLDALLAVLHAR